MHILAGIVFIVLLIAFPRATVFIIMAAIVAVVLFIMGEVKQTRKAEQVAKKQTDQMSINVAYDVQSCGQENPIKVTFVNNSHSTVNSYRFDLEALPRGYSSIIHRASIFSDKIVYPRKSDILCFNVGNIQSRDGQSPSEYEWRYRNARVDFK